MKAKLFIALTCINSLRAEITYPQLYAQSAGTAGAVALSSYLASQLCSDSSHATLTRNIGAALGIAAGATLYYYWRPEKRIDT